MYRLNSIINLNYCWNRHICMSLVYIPTMIHKCMKKCSHTFSLLIPPFKTSVYVWKKSYTRLVHQTQVKQWQGSRSDLTISGLVRLFLFITIVKFSTIYYNKLNSEKKHPICHALWELILEPLLHLQDNSVLFGHNREVKGQNIMAGFTFILYRD